MYYTTYPCMAQNKMSNPITSLTRMHYLNYPVIPVVNDMDITQMPETVVTPSTDAGIDEIPQTLSDIHYTPGFLKTQIGKKMRIEFLIGTNGPLIDRSGTLIFVGVNYIILQPESSDDRLLCDIYSIKFVNILL